MSLSPADVKRIKDAFNQWAKNHPTPNAPVIGISGVGHSMLSAKELAREIENETEQGKAFIHMVDVVVSSGDITLDQYIKIVTNQPPKP